MNANGELTEEDFSNPQTHRFYQYLLGDPPLPRTGDSLELQIRLALERAQGNYREDIIREASEDLESWLEEVKGQFPNRRATEKIDVPELAKTLIEDACD